MFLLVKHLVNYKLNTMQIKWKIAIFKVQCGFHRKSLYHFWSFLLLEDIQLPSDSSLSKYVIKTVCKLKPFQNRGMSINHICTKKYYFGYLYHN